MLVNGKLRLFVGQGDAGLISEDNFLSTMWRSTVWPSLSIWQILILMVIKLTPSNPELGGKIVQTRTFCGKGSKYVVFKKPHVLWSSKKCHITHAFSAV